MDKNYKKGFGKKFIDTLAEDIPLIKEARKNKLYLIVLLTSFFSIICLLFIGAFFFTKLFDPLIDLFVKNFGSLAVGNFFAVLAICIFFFGLMATSKILLSGISQVRQKWLMFFICSSTITLFLCGTVFIHAVIGVPNNSWKLFEGKEYVSDIICGDLLGKLIEGHKIWCTIENSNFEFKVIDGTISISLENGTIIEENFNNFIAPQNIHHISIKLDTVSDKGSHILRTGFYPFFYGEKEERQRQKDFLTYFFGLLFICLITIPQLVIKIRNSLKE